MADIHSFIHSDSEISESDCEMDSESESLPTQTPTPTEGKAKSKARDSLYCGGRLVSWTEYVNIITAYLKNEGASRFPSEMTKAERESVRKRSKGFHYHQHKLMKVVPPKGGKTRTHFLLILSKCPWKRNINLD